MLVTFFKEIKAALAMPGFWLIALFFNLLALVLDLLHFRMFDVAWDIFAMAVNVVLYFLCRVRK
jgi:hypothetical protein